MTAIQENCSPVQPTSGKAVLYQISLC